MPAGAYRVRHHSHRYIYIHRPNIYIYAYIHICIWQVLAKCEITRGMEQAAACASCICDYPPPLPMHRNCASVAYASPVRSGDPGNLSHSDPRRSGQPLVSLVLMINLTQQATHNASSHSDPTSQGVKIPVSRHALWKLEDFSK